MKKLLIQFATRERPNKFKKYLLRYMCLLNNLDNCYIHISGDTDDETMNNEEIKGFVEKLRNVSITFTDNKTKVQAINALPDIEWDILLVASDDMWPEKQGYDTIIREKFERYFPDLDGVLHFNDTISQALLNTLPVMGKKYYERFEFVYNPKYKSVFCDREFDIISRDLGRRVYFNEVIIRHLRKQVKDDIEYKPLYRKNSKYRAEDEKMYEEFANSNTHRKIIAFSLYGDEDKYCKGAIENIKLQKQIYPDWICRFYIDINSVPENIIDQILQAGCEVDFRAGYEGKGIFCSARFWRFEVMCDREIDWFIVRDADSRLSYREKQCVDQWIKKSTALHIIRDHPHHKHRIMGGAWGGLVPRIRSKNFSTTRYISLLKRFKKISEKPGNQQFLAQVVYPRFKDDVCIHDNRHFFEDEQPLKINRDDDYFVGERIWEI